MNNSHYMVKENGYSMQTNVLQGLIGAGVKEIFDTHKGTIVK